ncbi:YbaN family protein [Pseudomonas sp. RTB3]|nr:YbaN family protein [Pseudomonas sp. RTB3]
MTGKPHSTSKIAQLLFGLLAYVSLGIGLVAIVIPGLPTTEFILLAAWAATKSSPRLSAWLENHRLFGPILFNWRNGKIIARRAKVSATVSMLVCALLMLVMLEHHWPVYLAIAGMSLGNLWIWSRPGTARSPHPTWHVVFFLPLIALPSRIDS